MTMKPLGDRVVIKNLEAEENSLQDYINYTYLKDLNS